MLSQRVKTLTVSATRQLQSHIQQAKANGKNVYVCSIWQPDVATLPNITEMLQNQKHIPYAPSTWLDTLKQVYSTYMKDFGVELQNQDVCITYWASEALAFAIQVVANPGDTILTFVPFYSNYKSFIHNAWVNIKGISRNIYEEYSLPTMQDIQKSITDTTRAFLICNPCNPSGQVFSLEYIRQLCDLAKQHDMFVIVDEVYREFVYSTDPSCSLVLDEYSDRLIVVDSISKRYSLCGARVGMFVSKNQEVMTAVQALASARLSVGYIDQVIATQAITSGSEFVQTFREICRQRVQTVYDFFQQNEDITCTQPQGAFYCMLILDGVDTTDFCTRMVNEFDINWTTVALAPGRWFYIQTEENPSLQKWKNECRLALVYDLPQLQEICTLIQAWVIAYKNR